MKIEIELENLYKNWKNGKENKIFSKAKENKNILYAYIKKKESTKSKIGPFKGPKSGVEILREQYESVFITPDAKFSIPTPESFFLYCTKCGNQEVHICHQDKYFGAEDYCTIDPTPITLQENGFMNYGSHFSLTNIYISRNDMRKAMEKLPNSASCGPDSVPSILIKNCIN